MDIAIVEEALKTAGLDRLVPHASKLAQPSLRIRLRTTRENNIPRGASKFGGSPDLPPDFKWPALNGTPMSFIAQIRFDDVHTIEAVNVLPETGLLSFFYDASQETYGSAPGDKAGWFVTYQHGENVPGQLKRTPPPASLPRDARFKPCSVTFASEWTLPERPGLEVPGLELSPEEVSKYEDLYANFPSHADRSTPQHRLLGHPDTIQDDMRTQCQLVSHGVTSADDPGAAELLKGAMEWRLLLQVDTDEDIGMRWASTGMLYYWIQRDALQALRFEDVWLVLQSE